MADSKKTYEFVYVFDNSNRRHLYERCTAGMAILWFMSEYSVEKGAIDRIECLTATDDPDLFDARVLRVFT